MDIQQTDRGSLATYVHRFKWEASRCKFNNAAATIWIFLKGLKNAHTIATKVYEKGPQTLAEAIKEVEKLQATRQITSTLLPTSSVNTMSSDNERCFQCQEIGYMACYCPHIQCYDCDNYGHVAMDCPDEIPPSGKLAYCRSNTTDRHDRSSSRHHSHTRHFHHVITRIDPGLVIPDPAHITIDIGVAAIMTPIGAASGHFTDLPNIVSHATEAQVPTAIAVTHCTTDLHPIGIFPEMTADLNTNPKNNITNQHKDTCPPHKQHLGNIGIRDTSRSPLMTHPQNTTAQMIMIVTQRMI